MLTQDQITFFHTNGFLIMRGLLKGQELQLLIDAANRVQAEGLASGPSKNHWYKKLPDGRNVYWRSEEMWERGDIFQAVTVNPEILENIGQAMGDSFFPWNDSLVVKQARIGAQVEFHQDPPYGDPKRVQTFGVPNFTTDLYLDHSGPDNGCVWALEGRHLVGHVDWKGLSEDELFDAANAQPIEMEAGDVLFHSLSTPHGSRISNSDIQRRIFYIHYINQKIIENAKDAYGSWGKDGWTEARRQQILGMIEKRKGFGWAAPDQRDTLRLGDQGFEFVGQPKTPANYWQTLASQIPPERREALKHVSLQAASHGA